MGGSETDTGGGTDPAPAPLSTNLSGVWSGTALFIGAPTTVNVNQATTGRAPVASLDNILSINQTLTAGNKGKGMLMLQVGPPENKGTVDLRYTARNTHPIRQAKTGVNLLKFRHEN